MRKRISACLLFLLLLGLLGACSAGETEMRLPEKESFSCGTLDQQGEWILGFAQEGSGEWRLFVPSSQSLTGTKLYYTGDVVSTTGGKLDRDDRTVSGAFSKSGDGVTLTLADGSTYTVTAMQSQLPSVQIRLNGTTLEQIHADKTLKYEGNTFVLTTPGGRQDLLVKNSVQVKGRGNTTWDLYEKKGYQIKFATPTSILGMGAAKKWVLLANAGDDSLLRTKLSYNMAGQLDMAFVPSFEFVDLWIDGDYRGTYLLGEKVEIEDSRLDLSQYDGALFEHDEGYYRQNPNRLYNTLLQRHFVLKEVVTEEDKVIAMMMDAFNVAVEELMTFLLTASSEEVTLEALGTMIDIDSFAKYYLINEYVLNCESFSTSFYWYMDGREDVLHLGPVWDFDTCMGNDGMLPNLGYGENHILFKYLLASPEFYDRTEKLYEQYRDAFEAMSQDAQLLGEEIRDSAEMNYQRWDLLGTSGVKKGAQAFHDTFQEAVTAVGNWLAERYACFAIPEGERILRQTVYTGMSENQEKLLIYLPEMLAQKSVKLCVWNLDDPNSPMVWRNAERFDRTWQTEVDLRIFSGAGTYSIHVYADGAADVTATGRCYVEEKIRRLCAYTDGAADVTAIGHRYVVEEFSRPYCPLAKLSEDGESILLKIEDDRCCEGVSIALWSDANGQDDIQWLTAIKNDQGQWQAEALLSDFRDRGLFHIHIFEQRETEKALFVTTTLQVDN